MDAAGYTCRAVSVPWRGMDCIYNLRKLWCLGARFRPLAGCGLHRAEMNAKKCDRCGLPSPSGVWIASNFYGTKDVAPDQFPSPGGERAASWDGYGPHDVYLFPSPDGVRIVSARPAIQRQGQRRYRPLAGSGLYHDYFTSCLPSLQFSSPSGVWIASLSVTGALTASRSYRPLAGYGLHRELLEQAADKISFRPLAGSGLYPSCWMTSCTPSKRFPSPGGVWIASL